MRHFSFYGIRNPHRVLSPAGFAEKMSEIKAQFDSDDLELCHVQMDRLMCDTLRELGYEQGIAIFEGTERYYA